MGDGDDGDRGFDGDGLANEVGGGPDFVEVADVLGPFVREVGQLPGPVSDIVSSFAKGFSVVVVDIGALGGVDVEDVYGIGIFREELTCVGLVAL